MPRLKDTPCPQCQNEGGLVVVSILTGNYITRADKPDRNRTLAVVWRPVLDCEHCDLYSVGRYTVDGNAAVFDGLRGSDDQPDVDPDPAESDPPA